MDERRKSERMQVSDYKDNNQTTPEECFQVFDGKNDQFIGYLVDISVEGLMILSDQPIKQETLLIMKVELPENITDGEKLLIKAKSLWWHQEENQESCRIGFKIEHSSLDLTQIIHRLFKEGDTMGTCQKIPIITA
ncbi:MAG: PilZ domain-containing protein [FCB group bacterium]|nr:PilZ domain-containing protein [FCB group bacterium]